MKKKHWTTTLWVGAIGIISLVMFAGSRMLLAEIEAQRVGSPRPVVSFPEKVPLVFRHPAAPKGG